MNIKQLEIDTMIEFLDYLLEDSEDPADEHLTHEADPAIVAESPGVNAS